MITEVSKFGDEKLIKEIAAGRKAKRPPRDPQRMVEQIVHRSIAGAGVGFDVYEALIGENDLIEINYLERGMMAARAVCRLNVPAVVGDSSEWGTGFLIGPRLLLTNNHVLRSPEDALRATVEFGYELDVEGRLKRTTRFRLTPEDGFVTSPKEMLDYTIVAIAARSEEGVSISDFGFLRLDPRTGKTEVGQYATIIEHPDAKTKRIALRENKIVKYGDETDPARDNFLWYSSDTAPGASGAPVVTDAWQVICLHHSGVPDRRIVGGQAHWVLADGTTAPAELAIKLPADKVHWLANEGVRISKLVADLEERAKPGSPARSQLIDDLIADATAAKPFAGTAPGQSIVGPPIPTAPVTAASFVGAATFEAARQPTRHTHPASYFDNRKGYQPDFLTTPIPLPTLGATALRYGSPAKVAGAADDVLRYLHFSLVLNGDLKRKMAFFTAVNIDGTRWTSLDRGNDVWFYDPRVPEELQNGDELYGDEPGPSKNYFDRGHLVRRLDPVWGDIREAKQANDDTFQWTNCSPQYWGFNQGEDLWQGLENFLLYNTDEEDVRASVFSGPLFRSDDEEHRGILIPQFFWKIIAVNDKSGKLYTSAYMVSQQDYALNIPFERLPVGPNSTKPGQNFQVAVTKIENETGIIFADVVRQNDVYQGPESGRPLRTVADIQHPRR